MKSLTSRLLTLASLILVASSGANAQVAYYWDGNDASAGFGTASGTWSASTVGTATAGWSTSATGALTVLGNTVSTTSLDSINFGNGTAGLAAGTITVSGTVSAGSLTFASGSGAIVLSGGTIDFGSTAAGITVNNASNTISSALANASSLTKSGSGTLILTGTNTYTGTTTINRGILTVGNGTTGSLNGTTGTALTFTGTGTFNVAEAAGSSQGMGALTLSAGDATITSTGIAAQNSTLTFGSMNVRSAGATANFVLATNTTASQNKIVLTSTTNAPVTGSGSNDAGIFFGGTEYARFDTTLGYFKAVVYGTDNNAPAIVATAATFGFTTSATDIKVSGNITAQTTASVNTLNLVATTLTLSSTAQVLSVNGIISTGGTIATAGLLQPAVAGGEIVINATAGTTTIAPIIQNNTTASSLTKSGAGTLKLNSVASTYSGGTIVNAGTLLGLAVSGAITETNFGTGPVVMNPGTTLALDRTYVNNVLTLNNATVTAGNSFSSTIANSTTLIGTSTFNITGGFTVSGNMSGAGNIVKTGSSNAQLSGANTYTGTTTVSGGHLVFVKPSALYNAVTSSWIPSNITVASGAVLVLQIGTSGTANFNSSQVDTLLGNLTTGLSNNGLLAGSFFSLDTTQGNATYSSAITDSTGTGGGAVGFMKQGGNTLTLGANNTFTGPVFLGLTGATGVGNLQVSSFNSINNGSPPLAASSLGRPTTMVNGTITMSYGGGANPTLIYTGSGETTDRILKFNTGSTTETLDQSGTGLLKFTSATQNTANGARTLTLQGSTAGTGEIAGLITDNGALGTNIRSVNKAGTGTWTLSAANTYSGTTKVTAGTLIVSHALGLQNSAIDTTGAGTLSFTGLSATPVIGGLSGTTGNLATVLGAGYTSVTTLTLNVPVAATSVVYGAVIANGAANMNLTKIGAGTQTLFGTNTFTGTTTINGGVLALDFSQTGAPATNIINATSVLAMTGGQLTVTGKASTTNSQTFASTGILQGANVIADNANATSNPLLTALGAISRTVGATVNFSLPTGSVAANNGITTTTANAFNGIIGGWATVGIAGASPTWAVNSGNNIIGLPAGSFTTTATAGNTAANYTNANVDMTTSPVLTGAGTINANSLRFNVASALTLTLDTGTNILQSGGIIVGTTVAANASIITGGSITGAAGASGDLVVVQNNSNASGTLTIASNIVNNGGSNTALTKSGAGVVLLTGTGNTFSGGTFINAGTLNVNSNTVPLGSTGNVTFGGNGSLAGVTNSQTYTFGTLTINGGAIGNIVGSTSRNYNFTTLSGSGTLTFLSGAGAGTLTVTDASTFTGAIQLGSASAGSQTIQVPNLSDAVGSGNIQILNGAFAQNQTFKFVGTSPLTFSNRSFEFVTAGNNTNLIIDNSSTGTSNTLTVNTPLLNDNSNAKTLQLSGSNTGANTWAGNITDGTGGGSITVSKTGTGIWNITGNMSQSGGLSVGTSSGGTLILSGTNIYTGTTINAFSTATQGTLVFQGIQALSPNTTLQQTHAGGVGGFGAIKILDDSATPASRSGVNMNMLASNTTHAMTLFVGNNNTTNGGNSSGTTTGSTIVLGNLNFTQNVSGNTSETLVVTGANGYKLQIGNVNLPSLLAGSTSWSGVLSTTSAPLVVTGTVQQIAGSLAGTATLTLDGTDVTGNSQVTGSIKDSVDGRALGVSKTSAGLWILNGSNTYSGATTVGGGTLVGIGANVFGNTSSINIAAASTATLSLRGDTSTNFAKAIDNSLYAVTTTANGATINVDQATVAGTSAKTMTVGTLQLNTAITNGTTFSGANNTSLSVGAVTTGTSASGTETLTNSITGGGLLTLASVAVARTGTPTLAFAGNGNTNVTGAITEAAPTALTKSGTGTLTVNGNNAYTGTTTLSAGSLVVNGSHTGGAAYSISAGTLAGTGAIAQASGSGVTVSSGANLAPGNATTGLGQLTIGSAPSTNNLTLNTGSTFKTTLGGANLAGVAFNTSTPIYSQLSVLGSGSIALNGSLSVALSGYSPTANDVYVILNNQTGAASTGTGYGASGTTTDGNFTFNITYTSDATGSNLNGGNSIALYNFAPTVVPEPVAMIALSAGLFGLGAGVRRRRTAR